MPNYTDVHRVPPNHIWHLRFYGVKTDMLHAKLKSIASKYPRHYQMPRPHGDDVLINACKPKLLKSRLTVFYRPWYVGTRSRKLIRWSYSPILRSWSKIVGGGQQWWTSVIIYTFAVIPTNCNTAMHPLTLGFFNPASVGTIHLILWKGGKWEDFLRLSYKLYFF